MRRFIDWFSGFAVGAAIVLGLTLVELPYHFEQAPGPSQRLALPTPRPPQHADPGPGTPGMTTEPRLPSPDVAAGTGLPDKGHRSPSPSPSPTGTRPAVTAKPKAATPLRHSIRGNAVWYDYRRGHAAAGPELRRALGAGWRGRTVSVCSGSRCVRVVLSDWCACRSGNRVVDLDRRSFAALADPSRGVIPVTVRW